MRACGWIFLAVVVAGCSPSKDPTTFMGAAAVPTPGPTGPGVNLYFLRKGDFLPAVLNVWVEDAGQNDIRTLRTYDTNAWSYSSNPYSVYLFGCPCSADPLAYEMAAYWPRYWAKSNGGGLVDAASHATSTYNADTGISVFWDWRDRGGLLVPNGNYTLWVEYSSYLYGGTAPQAPTAHVTVVRNGAPGSAAGTIVQGSAILSLSADWLP